MNTAPTSAATHQLDAHAVTFRHTGASVTLHTNSPATLNAARTTLYSYQQQPAEPAAWQVHILHDPATSDDGAASADGRHIVNIGPRLFAYLRVTDSRRTFWVPDLDTQVTTDEQEKIIRVRCAGQDAAVHWAPRLVRQAMTAQLLAAGMIYAHAAAFTCRDHGVLIAGHRGRGKTTTLLASLHRLGGDYVTNDRLMLHSVDGGVRGYPWPMPLRAGIGTLTALPHLTDLVPAPQRAASTAERWVHPGKIVIEPPDFPRLLRPGGHVADRIIPTLMIWPWLDPGRSDVQVVPVLSQRTGDVLLGTRMFMTDPDRGTSAHINHWLVPAPPDHITDAHLERTAAALAGIACYEIRAGADPTALADAVGTLLDTTEQP